MQTFLAYADFRRSAEVLDYRRLCKQRLEARQLIETILDRPTKSGKKRKGWKNHPATKMWYNYVEALKLYYNIMVQEWIRRGYNNTMQLEVVGDVVYPSWLGDASFHASHRSNLLRKDPEHYGKLNWTEPNNLPYVWPL